MKNMYIAFTLNLLFAIFELIGGLITGSVAIASDAIHDLSDAFSIGISAFLERKSKQPPNDSYTFGYGRLSILGALFTTCVLLAGSFLVIYRAVHRIISPAEINYNGMILFAIIGVAVNLGATVLTKDGHSVNQRAVNLHMLEDVLGWIVVLIGSIVMRCTGFRILDPILSIVVAVFIIINAVRNLIRTLEALVEKIPDGISLADIKDTLNSLPEIEEANHIQVWTLDGENHIATAHIVTTADSASTKEAIRAVFANFGIKHVTIELHSPNEPPPECHIQHNNKNHLHHHHH